MNFNQRIEISKELLSQEVSGETVLLDLDSESYFGLNEVGTRIWQLLQDHGNLQRTYDTLLEEFDVDAERLRKDLEGIVTQLSEAGLITLSEK